MESLEALRNRNCLFNGMLIWALKRFLSGGGCVNIFCLTYVYPKQRAGGKGQGERAKSKEISNHSNQAMYEITESSLVYDIFLRMC